jgi:IS5 family transposase
MRLKKEGQIMFMKYDLEKLVNVKHPLRAINTIVSFDLIGEGFRELIKGSGRKGYGVSFGIKCLFLQFFYDLSDRQMEERLQHDMAFRWFCGLTIDEETPDHSYFGRMRVVLGTERIATIFRVINEKAEGKNILRKVFSFVDSSAIKSKETTWDQRDKAIKDGEEALNNSNVDKYSADPDARFGCKGKKKFWYGYKRHADVDMGSGLIKDIAVTPANVTDQDGLKHVCPDSGMVFADKQYCCKKAQKIMKANSCHSGAIMKNNMLAKNKDKDKWISRMRAPFEGVFSKFMKRARYRTTAKVQMQAFLEAIVFNLKRLVVIGAPPLFTTPC